MESINRIETPLGEIIVRVPQSGNFQINEIPLPTSLYNGMKLDQIIALLITVVKPPDSREIVLSCTLNGNENGSPEPGEHLECVTWQDENWSLSVGTEDAEMLGLGLNNTSLSDNLDLVKCHPNGIVIQAPTKELNYPASLHFVLSYKRLPDDSHCATWFAVDVHHSELRKYLR